MYNIYILKWLCVNSPGEEKKKVQEAHMLAPIVGEDQSSTTMALPV